MVNCYRIKEYIFPSTTVADSDYVATGSRLTKHSHVINGEILRVEWLSNFAGSLILGQSGLGVANMFMNQTVASGTNKWESVPFSATTGSYAVNDVLKLVISGTASGTGVGFGEVHVFYR
jgi:hypothetical protein